MHLLSNALTSKIFGLQLEKRERDNMVVSISPLRPFHMSGASISYFCPFFRPRLHHWQAFNGNSRSTANSVVGDFLMEEMPMSLLLVLLLLSSLYFLPGYGSCLPSLGGC